MAQTPLTPDTDWIHLRWSALILSAIAAAVFGLLAGCGAGLRGFSVGEPGDFGAWFNVLAWISVVLAPVLAWIFVGLVVLMGGIVLMTRKSPSGTEALEFGLQAVSVIAFYALVPVVLLFAGPFVLWTFYWFSTWFGTCVPPACKSVPAVP
ncbi:hypothetical protein DL990_31420 [Amycolatopsis sp. WAC 01416]|uniref:hypothetical protein n=1 Tax=Amycolatopsis sp. WAC 01416 TaxID=2203196 RepID=UPI000F795826|nr:hypothetical protein [Amycolatopsis sp. WAC 01416]RSN25976.1 hypothetical protein DL990_31420 [Amycolatopsis sp. WAC 01416]